MPATTSTVQTVIDRLVTLLDAALTTEVKSFPPLDATTHSAFIGQVRDGRSEVDRFKAGRKSRQETYLIDVWFRHTVDQTNAPDVARAAVTADFAALENILADDVTLGLASTVSPTLQAFLEEWHIGVRPPPDGWRAECRATVRVTTRLN